MDAFILLPPSEFAVDAMLKKQTFLEKKKRETGINSELSCSSPHNLAHSTMERDKVMRE